MKNETDRFLNWEILNELDEDGFNILSMSFDGKVREIAHKGRMNFMIETSLFSK